MPSGCDRHGVAGLQLYPHKQAILEYLDELAPGASITGAVNTVIIRDGRLTGRTPTDRASCSR